jgi:uncharacterized protein YkwD
MRRNRRRMFIRHHIQRHYEQRRVKAIATILLWLFVALPSGASHASAMRPMDARAPTSAVAVSQVVSLEHPILVELNRIRRAHGLRPLRESPQLTRAAHAHLRALALSGQFRHEWPDGRHFDRWIRRFYPLAGARVWAVGENLIWSSTALTPDGVARAWLASPPHRHILLTPYWRELGIGAIRADHAGGVYDDADVMLAAAEFGARS